MGTPQERLVKKVKETLRNGEREEGDLQEEEDRRQGPASSRTIIRWNTNQNSQSEGEENCGASAISYCLLVVPNMTTVLCTNLFIVLHVITTFSAGCCCIVYNKHWLCLHCDLYQNCLLNKDI